MLYNWDKDNPVVPFDKYGNMLNYDDYGSEMKLLLPFRAILTIVSYSRGRSAANWTLEDSNNKKYSMFMTDMLDLILDTNLNLGQTEYLEWKAIKRGSNYGIARVSV